MTLRLNGDSSGFTEIKAANAAGDNSISLPASNGGANQLLKNGSTAGELEYESNVTVDSSGRLCIGNASPDFAKTANIQGSSGSVLMLSSEDTTGVQDTNASIEFRINDGASGRATAEIRAGKESATAGNQNSYISFVTRDTSNRERIRIASNGALKLLSDCPGIDFSGISSSDTYSGTSPTIDGNTLDDYEEGTFVVKLTDTSNNALTINSANDDMRYIKVGRLVTFTGRFNIQALGTASGPLRVHLPFTTENSLSGSGVNFCALQLQTHGITLAGSNPLGTAFVEMAASANAGVIYCPNSGSSWEPLQTSNLNFSSGVWMYVTGSMRVTA